MTMRHLMMSYILNGQNGPGAGENVDKCGDDGATIQRGVETQYWKKLDLVIKEEAVRIDPEVTMEKTDKRGRNEKVREP